MAHRRNREQWRQLVTGWPPSGLTQGEYCEQQGISLASLRRWRSIFAKTGSQSQPRNEEPARLLPVQLVDTGDSLGALTLVLDAGVRIEIGRDFDGPTLKRLLTLLRAAS